MEVATQEPNSHAEHAGDYSGRIDYSRTLILMQMPQETTQAQGLLITHGTTQGDYSGAV
jgi:hypothetical protein